MPVQKTRAIVIRTYPLGEYDKIIVFYTADFGKVRAVARGVKRPKSRFGGSLELMNFGSLLFFERPNKDLHIVNDFDLIDAFDGIKEDFDRTTYGFYLAELVDTVESDQSVDQKTFSLLQQGFSLLALNDDSALLARAFEIKLLDTAGFAPQLSCCVSCTSLLSNATLRFSPSLGGLLCTNCEYQDGNALPLARGSCELMKHLRKCDLTQLNRVRASKFNHRQLQSVLSSFISYHTERTLKSLALIEMSTA